MSISDRVKDRIVARAVARMSVPGAEPGSPFGLFFGFLPYETNAFKKLLRGAVVGLLAYALLNLQPTRVDDHLHVALLLGLMSCLTLTQWASVTGLGALLVISVIPPGYIQTLLALAR